MSMKTQTQKPKPGHQDRILQVLNALIDLPINDWRTADIASAAGVPHIHAASDLRTLAEHQFVRPTAAGWCPGCRFLGIAAKLTSR